MYVRPRETTKEITLFIVTLSLKPISQSSHCAQEAGPRVAGSGIAQSSRCGIIAASSFEIGFPLRAAAQSFVMLLLLLLMVMIMFLLIENITLGWILRV